MQEPNLRKKRIHAGDAEQGRLARGGIQQIQTHGNMLNANAHIHSLVTDRLFEENGVFYCMPEYTGKAKECLQKIFEKKIYDFALKNRIATEETIRLLKSGQHRGFSVYVGEPHILEQKR